MVGEVCLTVLAITLVAYVNPIVTTLVVLKDELVKAIVKHPYYPFSGGCHVLNDSAIWGFLHRDVDVCGFALHVLAIGGSTDAWMGVEFRTTVAAADDDWLAVPFAKGF